MGDRSKLLAKRKADTKSALRDKFKGVQYISQIARDYVELGKIDTIVKNAKSGKLDLLAVQSAIDKANCRVKIIKVKMDTNFRRLAKVLPDLKSLELQVGDDDDNVVPVQIIINAVDASGT